MTASPPDLSVSFAGIAFKNPVIAASGTFGYGVEFEDIVALHKLGGFVVKGLSLPSDCKISARARLSKKNCRTCARSRTSSSSPTSSATPARNTKKSSAS